MMQKPYTASLSFIAFALSLAFSACGPIYETQYSYTAPNSPQGQMCIQQCEMTRLNCEQMEDMRQENCEYRAERDYDYCMDHRYHKDDYCSKDWCSTDYSQCERRYNMCYQSCGGQVSSKQVCTAFCDQAPPR